MLQKNSRIYVEKKSIVECLKIHCSNSNHYNIEQFLEKKTQQFSKQ